MKLHRIAIALAAFSIAGGAIAAGTEATTTTAPPSGSQAATSGSPSTSSATGQANAASPDEGNPALVRSVQQALKQKGYDTGSIDGHVGPSTQKALRDFQQAQGLPQSGSLDHPTLSALGVDANQGAMQDPGASPMQGQERMPNTPSTNGASAPSSYK